ncbi:MAG: hypothetical protein LBG67_02795 [Campylobacteraceae bacterium]|jgi:hypothetical protein|nr:hypothetical protein [Campylobacteraceae bacterium]
MVAGCTPQRFHSALAVYNSGYNYSDTETVVFLRKDLDFDKAFNEVVFALNRNGFEIEEMQPQAGYIRSKWSSLGNEVYRVAHYYKVRAICNFNPDRTKLVINAEAQYKPSLFDSYRRGSDSIVPEILRKDINMVIGN